jgi:hypothetical protein
MNAAFIPEKFAFFPENSVRISFLRHYSDYEKTKI